MSDSRQFAFFLPRQELSLEPIKTEGKILDIGGGGEGVIAQLMGSSVVAIDRRASELEEAREASGGHGDELQIIMDARELQFLDCSFPCVTCFFSLMYMAEEDLPCVLSEIQRVLKPGGDLWIWDFYFPVRKEHAENVVAYPLSIHLMDKVIDTGYGCRWPQVERNLEMYSRHITAVGLNVVEAGQDDAILNLRCVKPQDVT